MLQLNPYTRLYSATAHTTKIFIATGVMISNFAHKRFQFFPLSFCAAITSNFTAKQLQFTSDHR